jgi:hypothetical protein
MNTHTITHHRPIAVSRPASLRAPRASLAALRHWLNAPADPAPTPIAGHMYGLLLRPTERPDIERSARR